MSGCGLHLLLFLFTQHVVKENTRRPTTRLYSALKGGRARASFALYNTTEDADAFVDALIKAREFFA